MTFEKQEVSMKKIWWRWQRREEFVCSLGKNV